MSKSVELKTLEGLADHLAVHISTTDGRIEKIISDLDYSKKLNVI